MPAPLTIDSVKYTIKFLLEVTAWILRTTCIGSAEEETLIFCIMDRNPLEGHPTYERIKELGQGRYLIVFL